MGIYSYTFDFDTFKNDTFKSVIFKYSQQWLLGPFWHLGENFDFDTFKNDTFENDTFESVWASSISFESNPDFEIRASNLKKSIFMIIDLSQD